MLSDLYWLTRLRIYMEKEISHFKIHCQDQLVVLNPNVES